MHINDWRSAFPQSETSLTELRDQLVQVGDHSVFTNSVHIAGENLFCLVQEPEERKLIVVGGGDVSSLFSGIIEQVNAYQVKVCPLTTHNRKQLQRIFNWLNPQACGPHRASIGLGDRLGLASPGHIAAVKSRNVLPVLAQQSMRELNLTGRSYEDVLDAAAWAVFQEGYTAGFGADGDHLKKMDDVKMALDLGFSMITLDCSEHIDDSASSLTDADAAAKYAQLDPQQRHRLESTYLNQEFTLACGRSITFGSEGFYRMVLVYIHALDFAEQVYKTIIKSAGRPIDFEVSIDEVATPTTPQDHFFVANELQQRGVHANSIAPRFVGEFQKGIDYIGDPQQFASEFQIHAEIADHFGYKLSIHSGSDKFTVFQTIGQYTQGRFHLKTAGTSWLEAVRVVAEVDPQLYREIHTYALAHIAEARQYYHVSFNPADIPDISTLSDQQLPDLMNQPASRQALHISYGLILQAQNHGKYLFKDRFYQALITNLDLYKARLQAHIGRHLDLLSIT